MVIRLVLDLCAGTLILYAIYRQIHVYGAYVYRCIMARIIKNIVNATSLWQFNQWCSMYTMLAWNISPAFIVSVVTAIAPPDNWCTGHNVLGNYHLELLATSPVADRTHSVFITMVLAALYAARVESSIMRRCTILHEYWRAAIDASWWLWSVEHIYERCERRALTFAEVSPDIIGYYVMFTHGVVHRTSGVYSLAKIARSCLKVF